jgi:arginyl-tRNA synthetase
MNSIAEIKNLILRELNLGQGDFSYPPDSKLGDLSLACFALAKVRSQNPALVAAELSALALKNESLNKAFVKIEAQGPYLNFFLDPGFLAGAVISEIKKTRGHYGLNSSGEKKKVMIEYSNGNTHKEYHVGHLRNIAYGEAVKNILHANGYPTIPVSYINDFGIHVAKTIWNWRQNPTYGERPENKGYLLGKCYAEASQKLNDNPEAKEAVGVIMKNIESRQGADYDLWKKTRAWSISYFNNIYRELGIRFAHIFYENEVIADGLKIVVDLLEKGVLKKSQGAIIADLSEYGLNVLPIIRSDGTALYPVADLSLASKKFEKYHLDESIYVVDIRQSLYFKQLFKILELAGYRQPLIHLSYDFVTLPEGMMASRTGNVITYEDLKSKIFEYLLKETKKRHGDWTNSRLGHVALVLTISTIKFEMLKVGSEKIITFNITEAARFDGFTACYLQYCYARIKSLIRKGGIILFFSSFVPSLLNQEKEKALLLKMARYPELVKSAAEKYNPSEVAKYLFELAQLFNDYYHEVNILKADQKTRRARLLLARSVAQVIFNGFKILGLKALEEM